MENKRDIKDLRIVFMGTPEFAVASLDKILESGINIVGVVTAPDRPAGRGYQLKTSAVKEYALSKGLHIIQPEKLKSETFLEELKSLKADLQIVVAFRMLPEVVWNMPDLGTFNLHASLLPKYRGAAPINWAIINGEKETGVTTFFLNHEIDTGAIIDQRSIDIADNYNAGDLHDALKELGSNLVVDTIKKIANNSYHLKDQSKFSDNEINFAPKLNKDNCKIDWNKSPEEVHNLIRGLSPYPGAWTKIKLLNSDKRFLMKIFSSSFITKPGTIPGKVLQDDTGLGVHCKEGMIYIKDLQLEGKKRMKAEELLRGTAFDESYIID